MCERRKNDGGKRTGILGSYPHGKDGNASGTAADAADDDEFYYLAGFRDGIQLDWMVETMRKRKQEEP